MPGETPEEKYARERERALIQLVSLRAMVNDPRTVPGEAAAAQARINAMVTKYGITGPQTWEDITTKGNAVRAQKAKERAAAAEAYRQAQANVRDHDGLTAAEREWARRDPVGFAASRDKRTPQEKQRDMQDSWGQRDNWHRERQTRANRPHEKRCKEPYTFFDNGGNPRSRNTHRVKCDRCHVILDPGEGCVTILGAFCCETVPGPRKKRPERE